MELFNRHIGFPFCLSVQYKYNKFMEVKHYGKKHYLNKWAVHILRWAIIYSRILNRRSKSNSQSAFGDNDTHNI